jgi:hypothetical protein
MISLALSRHGGRKLPSTPEIDAALSDYARERAEILSRIEALFEAGYKQTRYAECRRWASNAAKERKCSDKLVEFLELRHPRMTSPFIAAFN